MLVLKWMTLIGSLAWMAPVRLEIRTRTQKDTTFYIALEIYGIPMHFSGTLQAERFFKREKRKTGLSDLGFLKACLDAARDTEYLKLCFLGRIGLEDAAASALIASGLQGAVRAIASILDLKITCRVLPDFARRGVWIWGYGIVCFRAGDIILMLAAVAKLHLQKRIKEMGKHGKTSH